MLQSSNPVLSESTFRQAREGLGVIEPSDTMTLGSTLLKSGVLLLLVFLTGSLTWDGPLTQYIGQGLLWGALGVGFVLALVISFKPTTAPYLAPVYALVKGMFLGAVSLRYELAYPGIALNAALLTTGVLGGMLLLYRTGLIRATARFRSVMIAAISGVMAVYLLSFVLSLFGTTVPFIHESGLIGIGFSAVVVVIAALSLILDFDLIERGVASQAPKYMEWYAGFALLVTLVWLYLEILRLLSKLRSR